MKRTLYFIAMSAAALGASANDPFIAKVYDFMPAPGQFVHTVPMISDDMTYEQVIEEVSKQLVGDERPGMISLGAFGGYVVFGFDHPVVNVEGQYDFKIYGNAFKADLSETGGSSESGIVMVSCDTNGNGLPDDEWFELKGSEHDNAATVRNFTIVYQRPSQTSTSEDIYWTSNSELYPSGTIGTNQFHTQSYWPGWLGDEDTLSFTGTRLRNNGTDMSEDHDGSYWVLDFFEWGYVDNVPDFVNDRELGTMVPNPDSPGFDISNAVDSEGNKVELKSVDFIKVYTALNQMCGWLGETSTEVCGARDLHPDAQVSDGLDDIAGDTAKPWLRQISPRTLAVSSDRNGRLEVYSVSGRLCRAENVVTGFNTVGLHDIEPGVYVVRLARNVAKVVVR